MKYIFVILCTICIVGFISLLEANESFYSNESYYSNPAFSDRPYVEKTLDNNGAVNFEELSNDLFSPMGLLSQLGQNFLSWFSSTIFLTLLIPFNISGKKSRVSRSKRNSGAEGSSPWDFSLKQLTALMRAVADVADNYKRYSDEL
uniref:Uncharacterized protein n=2 Tax=Lepeophtheirus salmonis TaxID=72036 RepID=A0A0K2UN47_LEPSM|nr:uncharacterized protein LOC121132178 [Lepeophtheirus salmonis]